MKVSTRVLLGVAMLMATLAVASPSAAAGVAYQGDMTGGQLIVHAGESQQVVNDPTGSLDLSWVTNEAAHDVTGAVILDPVLTPTFTGPFDLQLYVQVSITQTSPTTGTFNTTANTVSLATAASLKVTVYRQEGATQDPVNDDRLTGDGCTVNIDLGFAGTIAGSVVDISDPAFTIPTFPGGDSGCGLATDEINNRIPGPNNSAQLAFDSGTPTEATGFLRATTSPAVPGGITVNGVRRDSWGLNWVELPVGTYEVCFDRVSGFQSPACQSINITDGATSTVVGTYTPTGFIRVVTSPAVASTVSIDGHPANDWGLWTEIAPGTHSVCFGKVAGFDVPACRDVVVTAGATATTTGDFTANAAATGPTEAFGYLRATTDVPANSLLTIDGHPANSWGTDWVKLPVGSHELCFSGAPNATGPSSSCSTFSIAAGVTEVRSATFVAHGTIRVITSPALPATISLNGTPRNAWGVWTDVVPGSYQVCFGAVTGHTAPPCQTVSVAVDATTTVTGTYT